MSKQQWGHGYWTGYREAQSTQRAWWHDLVRHYRLKFFIHDLRVSLLRKWWRLFPKIVSLPNGFPCACDPDALRESGWFLGTAQCPWCSGSLKIGVEWEKVGYGFFICYQCGKSGEYSCAECVPRGTNYRSIKLTCTDACL